MKDHYEYALTIIRRHRGVYLASFYEQMSGTEEFDAYPTLAAAKRWLATETGLGRRIRWPENPDGDVWHTTWEGDL